MDRFLAHGLHGIASMSSLLIFSILGILGKLQVLFSLAIFILYVLSFIFQVKLLLLSATNSLSKKSAPKMTSSLISMHRNERHVLINFPLLALKYKDKSPQTVPLRSSRIPKLRRIDTFTTLLLCVVSTKHERFLYFPFLSLFKAIFTKYRVLLFRRLLSLLSLRFLSS